MFDVKCPYCGTEQNINHDGGYGYEEDCDHEQECTTCKTLFMFTTNKTYFYEGYRQEGDHTFKADELIQKVRKAEKELEKDVAPIIASKLNELVRSTGLVMDSLSIRLIETTSVADTDRTFGVVAVEIETGLTPRIF